MLARFLLHFRQSRLVVALQQEHLTELLVDMDRPGIEFQCRPELRDGIVELTRASIRRGAILARYNVDRVSSHSVLGEGDCLIQSIQARGDARRHCDHVESSRLHRKTLLDVPCGGRKVILEERVDQCSTCVGRSVPPVAGQCLSDRFPRSRESFVDGQCTVVDLVEA